jgi:ribonuclease VapC
VTVDSSALMAILLAEPEAQTIADLLARTDTLRMSAATYVEVIHVCDRRIGSEAVAVADRLIDRARIEIVPFTLEQAQWARHARLTYGVGRHPAGLNFGDCFAYALAKSTGEPLLFKGNDFSKTDVTSAI